jgi:hypothetical protein
LDNPPPCIRWATLVLRNSHFQTWWFSVILSRSIHLSLSLFSCVSACLCDILLCTATLKSLPVDAGCVSCGLCSIANEAREVPCKVYGDGFARRACQLSKVLCSHIS